MDASDADDAPVLPQSPKMPWTTTFTHEGDHSPPSPAGGHAIWWLQTNMWWDFLGHAWALVLEQAVEEGQPGASIAHTYGAGKRPRRTGYDFDFATMTQTNRQSETKRNLLRTRPIAPPQ